MVMVKGMIWDEGVMGSEILSRELGVVGREW